jgi:hypothetical protein
MVKKQNRSISGYGSMDRTNRYRSKDNSNRSDRSDGFGSYFRMGLGLGLGFMVVEIITTIIALVFFVSGFILLKREQGKEKRGEKVNNGLKILAYVLMFLGAIFALFLIIPILGDLGGEFE